MRRSQLIVLLGIVAVAINLRPAVASVSPLLETIQSELTVSYTTLSLLTTIPTLCMGVFALTAPIVTTAIGRIRGIYWGLVLITGATAVRLGSRNVLVLYGSTVLVGVGIAITQALLPSIVAKYFLDRESFVTGLYTASLTLGTLMAAMFTAPIAEFMNSWPAALAVWALLGGIGLTMWSASRRSLPETPASPDTLIGPARTPWRDQWAWVITVFFGASSAAFFFVLTWLAPRYVALGWTESRAGLLLGAFILFQLGGNLGVSAVGDRLPDQRPLIILMLVALIGGALGVAIVPHLVPFGWAVLLGIGTAGLFTISLTLPVRYASTPAGTDGLTAMMLGAGYLVAALGPVVGGSIRDLTGSYTVAFGGLVGLGMLLFGISILFSPDRRPVAARRSPRGKW